MLDQITKRKIDSARDILVGKVPDPKQQVDQITNALIYKFMDDMDKEAQELGGKAKFFTGDLEEFAWSKLLDRRLSGQERLDLYVRAINLFSKAKQLPQLFRDIFKDSFLPYRDPETLSLFLKEIDNFTYDHSEDLGDAFEYLLSILGSQGDAGQFRTPRHIIDFIVEVIKPKKDQTILDPACGTAGFLISAYKHILRDHDGLNNKTGKPTNKEEHLTPDERKKMMNNFVGYDISPDMVKLSLVNMYLHGFQEPKIYEYDTLSSEKHWGEQFDVIIANPPFMTPKGGIRPHKRFSVQANRSEVLFTDYILEHLNLKGRAGIIVPEGIIFKNENAYKQLRQMLIEDGLFAVVSLPQGVFNPYSGVKTSVLFFDNEIAKKVDDILFLKITDDGFDLGAQRRKIDKNDLPKALGILNDWKSGKKKKDKIANWATKKEIAISGDYNLAGERYKETETYKNKKWPVVALRDLIQIITPPKKIQKGDFELSGKYPIIDQSKYEIAGWTDDDSAIVKFKKPIIVFGDHTCIVKYFEKPFVQGADGIKILRTNDNLLPRFLYFLLKYKPIKLDGYKRHFSKLKRHKIPLPSIKVQKEIVAEIEVKQNAINHAKEVIKNLERERRYFGQEIGKLEGVKRVKLGEIGKICMCKRVFKNQTSSSGDIPFYKIGTFGKQPDAYISKELYEDYKTKYSHPKKGDILLSTSGTIGKTVVFDGKPAYFQDSNIVWISNNEKMITNKYLYYVYQSIQWTTTKGGTIERLYNKLIEGTKILLPSLAIQKQLVAEAEKEEEIITANKNLIEIMERKIEKVISEI